MTPTPIQIRLPKDTTLTVSPRPRVCSWDEQLAMLRDERGNVRAVVELLGVPSVRELPASD